MAGSQPRFEVYSGDRIDYPDGHFDAVVVFDAFHHLPNPQRVLGEFHRVLAPNCRLGMAEPGVGHADELHSKEEMDTGVLEREIDIEQLYQGGVAAGFQSLEVMVPGLHPRALTLPMRRLRWYMRGLSWLLPANLTRLAILGAPIVLLWKGPYFISSLHPRDQSAAIRPGVRQISCRPGEPVTIDTDVTNTGATTWLREGRHGRGYVRLGAHLLSADGTMVDVDFARAPLPRDLSRGERAAVSLRADAPRRPGATCSGSTWSTRGLPGSRRGGRRRRTSSLTSPTRKPHERGPSAPVAAGRLPSASRRRRLITGRRV